MPIIINKTKNYLAYYFTDYKYNSTYFLHLYYESPLLKLNPPFLLLLIYFAIIISTRKCSFKFDLFINIILRKKN